MVNTHVHSEAAKERQIGSQQQRRKLINQAGFTLIEVMIVIVILGILASLIIPRVIDRPDQARVVKAKQDLRTLDSTLAMYRLDNFHYPTAHQGLEALMVKPQKAPQPKNWLGPYLDRLPEDPWGNEYIYRNPGEHREIDVFTYGADGKPGGEGFNADLGTWQLQ